MTEYNTCQKHSLCLPLCCLFTRGGVGGVADILHSAPMISAPKGTYLHVISYPCMWPGPASNQCI